jgi:hypothetical protein
MKAALLNTVLTVVFSGGHPTGPITTFSAPVHHFGDGVVACVVQNLGGQDVDVDAVLHSPGGSVLDSGQAKVPSGTTVELASTVDDGLGFYCGFTFDADPETVRTYIHVRSLLGGETHALFGSMSLRGDGVPAMQTMYSPPLRILGDEVFVCLAQNLGESSVEVDTALIDEDGAVVDSSTIDVIPGGVAQTIVSTADNLNSYCRFEFTAPPDALRGYVALSGPTSATAHLVLPAEAAHGAGGVATYSPILTSVAGDATSCVIQNLDDQPLMVSADQIDSSGGLDSGNVMVQPGQVVTIAGQTEGADNGYCKFGFDDEGDAGRGYITRFPSGLFADTDFLGGAFAASDQNVLGITTYSPPLRVANGQLHCVIENVSESDVSVHVEIDDGSGTIIAMTDVLALHREGTTALTTITDLTQGFCTFAFDGAPSAIRTYAVLTNAAGTRSRLIFAASEKGEEPPVTPTPTETSTPRPTFTHTASQTPLPTETPTSRPTFTPTELATDTATPEPTPTDEPTSTPTELPTATPAATEADTPTSTPADTATITPTPTAEPTATSVVACVGDCDGDGRVTVDEIIVMVNIALGASIEQCPAGDRDGDGEITVDEILAAVTNALDGCPA